MVFLQSQERTLVFLLHHLDCATIEPYPSRYFFLGLPAFNFYFIGVENNQRTNRCLARRSYPCRKTGILAKVLMNSLNWWWVGVYFHVTYSRDFFSSTYFYSDNDQMQWFELGQKLVIGHYLKNLTAKCSSG